MSYGAYPGPWKEANRQGFRPREGGANPGGFGVRWRREVCEGRRLPGLREIWGETACWGQRVGCGGFREEPSPAEGHPPSCLALQSWSVIEPLTSTPAGQTPLPTPRPTRPAPGTCPGTPKVTTDGQGGVAAGAQARAQVLIGAWAPSAAPPRLQEVRARWAVGARAPGAVLAQRVSVPDGRARARGPGEPVRCGRSPAGGEGRSGSPALTSHRPS